MNPSQHQVNFEYETTRVAEDGIFTALPEKLSEQLQFDEVQLQGPPTSKRITLWFRSGAKRVYHIRLIRSAGRRLVQIGGMDPATVLRTISICRDHFDAWFGITPSDIQSTLDAHQHKPD